MVIESFPQKENSSERTAKYLAKLEELKEKSLGEIAKIKEEEIDEPISGDDFSSAQQDRERREELMNNAKERLQEIEMTISWAQEHGFTCQVCGKNIEEDRLDADPASITCKEHVGNEDDSLTLKLAA
jgi:RNA polymerase-binding transcription factor DksA